MYNVNAGGDRMIDLTQLNALVIPEIPINTEVSFSKEEIKEVGIFALSNVHVQGKVYKNAGEENVLSFTAEGVMTIPDTISLEEVDYPFSIDYEEKIDEITQNDVNMLDFKAILWQNIVLEIPMHFTKVKDYSEFRGNGWKLIGEEDLENKNNPFQELKSKLGGE